LSASGFVIGDFFFNEAHWLLAFFYLMMAKKMPQKIDSSEDVGIQDQPVQANSVIYWIGIVLNGLLPIVQESFFTL